MKRVALTLGVCAFAALTSVRARADCTGNACSDSPHQERALQESPALSEPARRATEYLDVWVTRQVLSVRYGARHPDVVTSQVQLASLYRALPSRTAEDDASVLAWLRFSHMETQARLAEMGTRCGPQHIDLRGAELRRDALAGLIEARVRGDALPSPTA